MFFWQKQRPQMDTSALLHETTSWPVSKLANIEVSEIIFRPKIDRRVRISEVAPYPSFQKFQPEIPTELEW